MFIVTLFTIVKTWKQMSADRQIKNIWYIYTTQCYSAIKRMK